MGDSRRFDLFAKLISKHIPKDSSIADVACGKGYLQAALRQLGYNKIISWDKRNKTAKNRIGYRYGYFKYNINEKYDAIVAMHPDEGTDHAIMYAIKNTIPAIVCPCCVKPSATIMNRQYKFNNWVDHLKSLVPSNFDIIEITLKMAGRNYVMIIKPKGGNNDL